MNTSCILIKNIGENSDILKTIIQRNGNTDFQICFNHQLLSILSVNFIIANQQAKQKDLSRTKAINYYKQ